MKHVWGMEIAIQVNLIHFNPQQRSLSFCFPLVLVLQAEARFLALPTIDFTTLTSILLIKAAFLLGNVDSLLS